MVDFKKLRRAKPQQTIIDPIEIFRRLPKPPGINDLYTSQAEVLTAWNSRRLEKDTVVKLHTGGGKTLVGLLMAQSIMNETSEPVLYVVPTNQLLEQTCSKAQEYGITAEPLEKGQISEDVMNGKSVLVCTYHALFNGRSRFRVRGAGTPFHAAAIIADDAHVALGVIRDQFTLRVDGEKDEETYKALTTLFRNDFRVLGKLGTFDDVVAGSEYAVLEVPYWSWQARVDAVREHLRPKAETDHKFTWPFVRDSFEYCHCLISKDAIAVTPIFPLVDLIPTFADCGRRIFMSATIGDDSAIVRTFNADPTSVGKPITSRSLAGISERMILLPDLMGFGAGQTPKLLRKVIEKIRDVSDGGVVILVPSAAAAGSWTDVAAFADTTEKAAAVIRDLQSGMTSGPAVLANRYDGIDLPGEACRVLILDGLPIGTSEYDRFLATCLHGGAALAGSLAQRIEQGIGRGARGAGDYCVIFLVGRGLNAWIGRSANSKFLTTSTRAQLTIGQEVSRDVRNAEDVFETARRCLDRDKDWMEYHAETLAELAGAQATPGSDLAQAKVEREALRLWRDGHTDKAVSKVITFVNEADPPLDRYTSGWLIQMAARVSHVAGKLDAAQGHQKDAYAKNANLLRPPAGVVYIRLARPGKQAERIVRQIIGYRPCRAYLSHFEEVISNLTGDASSNQFEESLRQLGFMLGFAAQRPERTFGVGPDVLWLLDGTPPMGLVVEAKSRKTSGPLTKDDHGQLLTAEQWFQGQYTDYSAVRVSVIPTAVATPNASASESKALTLTSLQELVAETRELLTRVVAVDDEDEMTVRCEQLLRESSLRPDYGGRDPLRHSINYRRFVPYGD